MYLYIMQMTVEILLTKDQCRIKHLRPLSIMSKLKNASNVSLFPEFGQNSRVARA